jgi:hypothetical protein
MSTGRHPTGLIHYIIVKSQQRDKTDFVLRVAFLVLQLIDFGLTMAAARCGYPELNPLVKLSADSVYKLAIFKFLVPVIISWFVPGRWLFPSILILGCVVGWNIKELIMLVF